MRPTPDLIIIGFFFEAILFMPLVLITSLIFMAIIDFISKRLGRIIRYTAFPGIVLHELCHNLMFRITRIPILKHDLIVGKPMGVVGVMTVDTKEIRSFIRSLLVSIGPLLILSFSLYFMIEFWIIIPMHELVKYYFIFCLFIGLTPCSTDLRLMVSVAKNRLRQAFLEFCLFAIPFIGIFGYIRVSSMYGLSFSIWILAVIFFSLSIGVYLLWNKIKPHRNAVGIPANEETLTNGENN